ncbi:MAG: hypothetical protein F4180_02995, partial [Chloroflexi bacterium]|nr:hypothetical protein [Chloroflexota bacterium]
MNVDNPGKFVSELHDLTEVDALAERMLDYHLEVFERIFDADVFSIYGLLLGNTDDELRDLVEGRQRSLRQNRAVILLSTAGGYLEPVQRMVETLRHHFDFVAFVVPTQADSAGTIFVMSGDSIYMDYYSRLGPIDPQIETERGGNPVSASGVLSQYAKFVEKSATSGLSPIEQDLLLESIDLGTLDQMSHEHRRSIQLLSDWLPKFMFRDSSDQSATKERAAWIAKTLSDPERWHSHSHAISMDILKSEFKLSIVDFGKEPSLRERIRKYDKLLSNHQSLKDVDVVLHTMRDFKYLRSSVEF